MSHVHRGRPASRFLRSATGFALTATVLFTAPPAPSAAATADAGEPQDTARYILPPGKYVGLPTTNSSRDQLPRYNGLTPLRGNVADADIDRLFLPQDLEPIGATHEEVTGRPGLRLIYDEYGIPHV